MMILNFVDGFMRDTLKDGTFVPMWSIYDKDNLDASAKSMSAPVYQ